METLKNKNLIIVNGKAGSGKSAFLSIRKLRFFGWKSNLCIDERIFYAVHLSYKKEGSYYGNI